MTILTADHVRRALWDTAPVGADGQWPRRVTINIGKGDAAWNPGSTKRMIDGPAKITYCEYSDGGFDAVVADQTPA